MANLMKIIDHDKDGKQVKIRLAAIDCPEKGQYCTNAAKKGSSFLSSSNHLFNFEGTINRPYLTIGHI